VLEETADDAADAIRLLTLASRGESALAANDEINFDSGL